MGFKKFVVACEAKSWTHYVGNHSVTVQQLPDGRWLASMGLKHQIDTYGTSTKQDVFDDVVEALKFVGYPAGETIAGVHFPVPKEIA